MPNTHIGMKCACGLQFDHTNMSDCETFVFGGRAGVICPRCQANYIGGHRVHFAVDRLSEEVPAQSRIPDLTREDLGITLMVCELLRQLDNKFGALLERMEGVTTLLAKFHDTLGSQDAKGE